jgi:hypothetical protein
MRVPQANFRGRRGDLPTSPKAVSSAPLWVPHGHVRQPGRPNRRRVASDSFSGLLGRVGQTSASVTHPSRRAESAAQDLPAFRPTPGTPLGGPKGAGAGVGQAQR